MSTDCSLIQAPFRFRSVLFARSIAWLIASSKLCSDRELISVTRATDMACLLGLLGWLDDPQFEELAGDDQSLDLARPLPDLGELGVAHEPLDLVLLDVAVPAVDLDPGVRGA